jgi:Cd2+/Zn2+-exporting ATPase/Cu+-exporting ATPase
MAEVQRVEVPVRGMDCAECTRHVRQALLEVPGVEGADVLLAAEKAVVRLDPSRVGLAELRRAVTAAGYAIPQGYVFPGGRTGVRTDLSAGQVTGGLDGSGAGAEGGTMAGQAGEMMAGVLEGAGAEGGTGAERAAGMMTGGPEGAGAEGARVAGRAEGQEQGGLDRFSRPVLAFLGVFFGGALFVVVVGEWLGLFETLTQWVPWPAWLALVLLVGWPIYGNVLRAARRGKVIAHTLMMVGVIAACAVGEWPTAVMVAFFMRVGDYAEKFTTERARQAVRDLNALAPQTARLERDGDEVEVSLEQVKIGDVVIVRPGEKVPVDGVVVAGQATLDQAAITGESLPVEAGPGSQVYAATLVGLGSLRVRTEQVGEATMFGKVIRLVEEAEANRADVERVADRFSGWYLPLVLGVALLTLVLRRDPLAAAAVLVVACACAFALATPIAMLASIGAGARRGLVIKGGKYLELLEKADVLLIDKTGTLTLGRPQTGEIVVVQEESADLAERRLEVLRLAASAERYSEHPLAESVRERARLEGLALLEPAAFEARPGVGVVARVEGQVVEVGSRRMLEGRSLEGLEAEALRLEAEGKSLLFVIVDGKPVGLLAAADTLRPEVPAALGRMQKFGIRRIEILTGDNEPTARTLVEAIRAGGHLEDLELSFRANLLPEDKIEVVREYQAQVNPQTKRRGVVVMVGDGVNDAPALAQADVGMAMGAAGSDVAVEAAHVALMREDWNLVPEVFEIARRTMRVVRGNIGFTAGYNLVGITLAALGFLPPILAAALQSIPDLLILGNSSRLLRQKTKDL